MVESIRALVLDLVGLSDGIRDRLDHSLKLRISGLLALGSGGHDGRQTAEGLLTQLSLLLRRGYMTRRRHKSEKEGQR